MNIDISIYRYKLDDFISLDSKAGAKEVRRQV